MSFSLLSVLFFVLFISVGSFITLYAAVYMIDDVRTLEFLVLFVLFILFMKELVVVSVVLSVILVWEGIGFMSFYLICFWSHRVAAVRAGIQAVSFGKVGDLFLLLGLLVCSIVACSTSVHLTYMSLDLVPMFVWFLVIAGCFKTVHVGFHI